MAKIAEYQAALLKKFVDNKQFTIPINSNTGKKEFTFTQVMEVNGIRILMDFVSNDNFVGSTEYVSKMKVLRLLHEKKKLNNFVYILLIEEILNDDAKEFLKLLLEGKFINHLTHKYLYPTWVFTDGHVDSLNQYFVYETQKRDQFIVYNKSTKKKFNMSLIQS